MSEISKFNSLVTDEVCKNNFDNYLKNTGYFVIIFKLEIKKSFYLSYDYYDYINSKN